MPLGEIVGESLGGVLRFAGRLLFEVVFEFLIQGLGHIVIRTVRPGSEPGATACAIAGLVCWAALISAGYFMFRAISG